MMANSIQVKCQRGVNLILLLSMYLIVSGCSTISKAPLIPPIYDIVDVTGNPSTTYPLTHWKKVKSPSAVGWNQAKLESAGRWGTFYGSAAGVVVHKGRIIHAWGDVTHKYKCHSIRKTFMEALYGIHYDQGNIDLNTSLAELNIDDISSLSKKEKTATVQQLLEGRSGVYHEAAYETPGMTASRPSRKSYSPGKYYYYNNWDFNTQLAIFEQVTGKKIFDEFEARIAKPLGMEYYVPSDGQYFFEKQYSKYPAYPFRMTALDMARVGLLYLNQGKWQDEQLISTKWIKRATTAYSRSGGYGIGYKWKVSQRGVLAKYNTFFTTGRGGHRIFVIPGLDLVFLNRVNTDGIGNMGQMLIESLLKRIISSMPHH